MRPPEVSVVDFGVGNLLSVRRGLEYCGAKVAVTSDPGRILDSERVVLPGVGAFRDAMHTLANAGLDSVIRDVARRETPLLCICLGMQLLLEESEEFGITMGLGLIPGRVVAVPNRTVTSHAQRIPHIGWSGLNPCDGRDGWEGTLLDDNDPGDAAYFAHSFMALPADPAHRIADCNYGGHTLAAVIARWKVTGCQFHPEKSGEVGLKVLRRFLAQ